MKISFEITKSDDESPVPTAWRGTFREIVNRFRHGDFSLRDKIPGVKSLPDDDAAVIARVIASYGASLAPLPEEAWRTSICRWMETHWDVLIDLFTIEEGLSDLVMFSKVYEKDNSYIFEVDSVHVP